LPRRSARLTKRATTNDRRILPPQGPRLRARVLPLGADGTRAGIVRQESQTVRHGSGGRHRPAGRIAARVQELRATEPESLVGAGVRAGETEGAKAAADLQDCAPGLAGGDA